MSEIVSRRSVIALAGAGVAAAACTPEKAVPDCAADDRLRMTKFAFTCGNYGEDPNSAPPSGRNYPAFRPNYIALVYIGLDEQWKLVIRQANYHTPYNAAETPEKNAATRLEKAINVFKLIVPNDKKFTAYDSYHQIIRRNTGPNEREDFSIFKFNAQVEIFIFLQTRGNGASSSDIKLVNGRIISFGPTLTGDGTHVYPAKENYAFFDAREESLQGHANLKNRGRIIRIANYMTWKNEQGVIRTIDNSTPPQDYSMNIIFGARSGGTWIPIIIDPDTGNGMGNEPPPP